MHTAESEEKYPKIKSTNKYKEKLVLYRNSKVKSDINILNKSKSNTIDIKKSKRIRLKPINLINFYRPEKKLENIKIEYEQNSNSINKENSIDFQNKKIKKIFFRNNSSLPYQQLSKYTKTPSMHQFNNQLISNKLKKLNSLNNKNSSKINSAKSNPNINIKKKNLSSGDLSFSSDSKQNINNILKDNENFDINIDINKYHKKKKIFSSKSKSSHSIVLSHLELSSRHSGKERKKTKQKSYRKKWNLPKIVRFDKITGRYKENKNPIKFKAFERMFDYSPNYELVCFNDKKAYVQMSKEKKTKFKNYKINITRKYLCNSRNLINNSGDFYNILKVIREEKEKKEKLKSKMKKRFNIIEEYKYYKNKRQFYTIDPEKSK